MSDQRVSFGDHYSYPLDLRGIPPFDIWQFFAGETVAKFVIITLKNLQVDYTYLLKSDFKSIMIEF